MLLKRIKSALQSATRQKMSQIMAKLQTNSRAFRSKAISNFHCAVNLRKSDCGKKCIFKISIWKIIFRLKNILDCDKIG